MRQLRLLQSQTGIVSELSELEALIRDRRRVLAGLTDLGSSPSSCEALLRSSVSMQGEMTRFVEIGRRLAQTHNLSESHTLKVFSLLDEASDCQSLLERRVSLLMQTQSFFNAAQSASYRLDELETQLRNAEAAGGSNADVVAAALEKSLSGIIAEAVRQGEDVLRAAKGDSAGVRHTLKRLQDRSENLRLMLNGFRQSLTSRIGLEALKSFERKIDDVEVWIEEVVVKFLQTNVSFGSSYESASFFLENHKDLVNRIHMKTFELEGLRNAINAVTAERGGDSTRVIEAKINACNERLTRLMRQITQRMSTAEQLTKFQRLQEQLEKEMSEFEMQLSRTDRTVERRAYEESRMLIQQLYMQICTVAKNASDDACKMNDTLLDREAIVKHVEQVINKLSYRQTLIMDQWKGLDQKVKEDRKVTKNLHVLYFTETTMKFWLNEFRIEKDLRSAITSIYD